MTRRSTERCGGGGGSNAVAVSELLKGGQYELVNKRRVHYELVKERVQVSKKEGAGLYSSPPLTTATQWCAPHEICRTRRWRSAKKAESCNGHWSSPDSL